MFSIGVIAAVSVAAYALTVRHLERGSVLSVFFCIAAVLFSGALFVGGLFAVWSLRAALRPSSFRDGQIWVWPSAWHDAGVATLVTLAGAFLLGGVFMARRNKHLTRRCS